MGANAARLNTTVPLGREFADAWSMTEEETPALDQKLYLDRSDARIADKLHEFLQKMRRA